VLTILLSSPRVAPGLLTWQAWSALRAADRVLTGTAEHPLVPSLAAAGVEPAVVDAPPSADAAALAAFLSSSASSAAGPVVWLAPPGEAADPLLLGSLPVPHQVLDGSPELPGAHLLDLVSIMDTLRRSCPWDREQTHQSLLPYLLEEAYEAAETIETGDLPALREEIGDVMFQAFFHARVAAERAPSDGGFTIDDVADTLAAKLVRRHPHVFGSVSVSSAADVNANWEEIKKAERAAKAASATAGSPDGADGPSVLDGVSFGQPALSLAAQLQRRAARSGITVAGAAGTTAPDAGTGDAAALTAERVGDELMALVARARAAGLDPELELRAAARRFAGSVREREQEQASGRDLTGQAVGLPPPRPPGRMRPRPVAE
jgi:XTP/dITP diphosphohydrolase